MRKSLADKIEQYLKVLIERSDVNQIEIQRAELAETFSCVPSQVTYVISTRFTEREGYLTESRRGGKGYVRITRCEGSDQLTSLEDLFRLFDQFTDLALLTPQENDLLAHLMANSFNNVPLEQRHRIFEAIKYALHDYLKLEL